MIVSNVKWIDSKGEERIGYYLDKYVADIGDAIVKRVTNRDQDCAILFDGREGSGKTNASVCLAHYLSEKSGRPFSVDNIFFNIDEMIKFAGKTKEQIILWDEAALGGLAADWTSGSQRKLTAMLMVCRKKKHIFIFNIPRFYRLNMNIIERMHCLFHIYEDRDENAGNFMFIGQEYLEYLYQEWRNKRRAFYSNYKKFPPGHFSYMMKHLIDYKAYDEKKDKAISDLANTDKKELEPKTIKLNKERLNFSNFLKNQGFNQKERAKIMKLNVKTIRDIEKGRGLGSEFNINPIIMNENVCKEEAEEQL